MDDLAFVSIVIPCRDEAQFITGCLDSIIANDYPKSMLEVLVVDGMSEDRTREIVNVYVQRYPYIHLLDNPKKITPSAFNTGIKHAKGEVIAIMGAHASYAEDYISKCIKYLYDYNADQVGGVMMTVPRDKTHIGKAIALCLSHRFGVGNSGFRTGSDKPKWVDAVFGACFRRRVFEKIGLYNEELLCSQDMELNMRLKKAGFRTLLIPEIFSYYYARSDFRSFCKHNFRNGVWAILPFLYSTGIPVSWRHLVPLVFVLGLFSSAALALAWPFGLWTLVGIVGVYVVANLGASSQIAVREQDARYFLIMPVVFTSLHLGYGLGSLWGLIKVLKHTVVPTWLETGWGETGMLKRVFDFVGSSAGLAAFSPLFLFLALLIKLEDKGPVFYRGVRVGRHGKPFRIFKFRTMVANADKIGGPSTPDNDPRITRVGKFLRKYKLDELPQLINVLKGEMSLVGPRPEVQHYVEMFIEEEREILSVRPGITDWATLWNSDEGAVLAGSSDPEKTYLEKVRPEKIKLQLEYVRKRSFWIDIMIIFQTLVAIIFRIKPRAMGVTLDGKGGRDAHGSQCE